MSFPSSPTDGQLYTTALGTRYYYVEDDTAWKILGGIGGVTGIQGVTGIYGLTGIQGYQGVTGLEMAQGWSGTAGKIAKFTDSTTIGDSVLTEAAGAVTCSGALNSSSGQSSLNELVVRTTDPGQSLLTVWKTDSTSAAKIAVITPDAFNPTDGHELDFVNYPLNYQQTGNGPDGTNEGGGNEILSDGATYLEINQAETDAKTHLTYQHATRLLVDSTGAKVNRLDPFGSTRLKLGGEVTLTDGTMFGQQAGFTNDVTGLYPADVCFTIVPQNGGLAQTGSPIITGFGKTDGCITRVPGLTLTGIIDETDPDNGAPCVSVKAFKSSGNGFTASIDDAETAFQVESDSNKIVRVLGSGSIEATGYVNIGTLVAGTPASGTCSIYFNGTDVIARKSNGQDSTLSGTWA